MTFQLFGRSLHPELFQVHQSRIVERNGYKATIEITSSGHVITWRYNGLTLTEVATTAQHPLPQKRRLLNYKLLGERHGQTEYRGVKYQMNFSLEPVEPEEFWAFQQELLNDGQQQGLLHRFDSNGRIGMGAVSYVNFETRHRSFLVQAFHTFPEERAIVKSQSLIELP